MSIDNIFGRLFPPQACAIDHSRNIAGCDFETDQVDYTFLERASKYIVNTHRQLVLLR